MRAWKNSNFHKSSLGYWRRIYIIFGIGTCLDPFPQVTGMGLLLPPERRKEVENWGSLHNFSDFSDFESER